MTFANVNQLRLKFFKIGHNQCKNEKYEKDCHAGMDEATTSESSYVSNAQGRNITADEIFGIDA